MKLTISSLALAVLIAASANGAEQWAVFETSFISAKKYENPFVDVEVDVVFRNGDLQWLVPAFWAGDDKWTVRFAPPVQGGYTFQVKCSDPTNKGLNGNEQSLPVTAYTGDNHDWEGTVVKNLEPGVTYHVFYFDPATGRRFDQGTVMYAGPTAPPFKGHTKPLLLEETLDKADAASWKDYGTPTQRENARLVGGKGMVTVAEKINELDLMASVDANSDAEAGILLRFHDADNYLVALYSPLLKAICLHDRKNGQWGEMLGRVSVPEIGPRIDLVAAACGEFAALVLTDGQRTYATPVVKVGNTTAGQTGLWLFQIGERQEFGRFAVSATPFDPPPGSIEAGLPGVIRTDEYHAPDLPSPQDWVLVLERFKP